MTNSSSQRRALVVQSSFSPFGNKLIQAGYVNRDQMHQALVESRKTGKPLTQIIEALTGQALPPDLIRQYKKQQLFELKILYGVESMDPELEERPVDDMGELIDMLIPIDICRRHQLIPLARQQTQPPSVLVAMVHPDNLDAQDDLNRILRPQGLKLQRLVIAQEDYEHMIDRYLNRQLERERKEASDQAVDVMSDLEGLEDLSDAPDEIDSDLGAALKDAEGAPIINLANKIMVKALTDGVSDIHVEPQEECLRIRFRKDGVLQEAFQPFPKKITPAITSRFKIMAELDIAERRLPQDGRIRRSFQGQRIDFRVNTLPSRYGEKICMRLLNSESTQLGLDKLITDPDTLAMVRDMANKPFGLILVTGPTGSGKSTTLYSCLAERNDPAVNISTAEDPIEYALPGITQVQVIREKGMNFASILRAFMRQDPDIILVGETRDMETAKTAIEAALTGHLVLTTLHANDAPSSVARLDEMGVEPFMVSASLIGVCAQRLVRRVCSTCRVPYTPSPEELARFGLSASQDLEMTLYKANKLNPEQIQMAKEQGRLCESCGGGGYKGRVGVYEVMRMTEELEAAINAGASTDRIKEIAVEGGMKTLLAYSLQLVQEGYTTLEEVERVTFTDSGLEAELKAKRKTSLTCRSCGAGLQQEWLDCPYCMTPRFT
ncbi:MAG: type II/IV secretion system protein [Synechococcales cyanobacterium CRU_2_2]|nr:type II/IV secretion system protein [Synechococcales cyanobacterium CRU_2_2]